MRRKRKVFYPTAKRTKGAVPAGSSAPFVPPTVVTIDLDARLGRDGLAVGSRVTILGDGLYAGEVGVVERLISGGIPAALVRTEAGRTRPVRTIDLQPVARASAETVSD